QCPFCCGLKTSNTNSLAAVAPEIAAQWHPTKNGKLRPEMVRASEKCTVWWKCPEGPEHEWSTTIKHRASTGTACPFCSGRRVSSKNSLATVAPEIAAQWHPQKNGKLTPHDVASMTMKMVWWLCPR